MLSQPSLNLPFGTPRQEAAESIAAHEQIVASLVDHRSPSATLSPTAISKIALPKSLRSRSPSPPKSPRKNQKLSPAKQRIRDIKQQAKVAAKTQQMLENSERPHKKAVIGTNTKKKAENPEIEECKGNPEAQRQMQKRPAN